MVMPHSALRAGQHLKWRSGNYKRKGGRNAPSIGLNLRVHEPWDLDNVDTRFLPDAGQRGVCTVHRRRSGRRHWRLATVQVWRGDWQKDYAGVSRKSEALHHDDGKFKSPVRQTVQPRTHHNVDRKLFFVETVPHHSNAPCSEHHQRQTKASATKTRYNYEGSVDTSWKAS